MLIKRFCVQKKVLAISFINGRSEQHATDPDNIVDEVSKMRTSIYNAFSAQGRSIIDIANLNCLNYCKTDNDSDMDQFSVLHTHTHNINTAARIPLVNSCNSHTNAAVNYFLASNNYTTDSLNFCSLPLQTIKCDNRG